jgi:ABC-type uncharacterized transport system involved in gliding motility auxiliary subunit
MDPNDAIPSSFTPLRRFGIGFNVLLSVLLLLAIVVMVNYLAERHYRRFLWTGDARFELSPPTRQVLDAVTNEIKVTVLFDRDNPLYDAVSGLLKEYAYACPKLAVEEVNYQSDPDRADWIVRKYQLPRADADLVVFDLNGRAQVVRASELSELSDYDLSKLFKPGHEVRRMALRTEERFTSAIAALLEGKAASACYLIGDGENSPDDGSPQGYRYFVRLLQQKNVAVSPLRLIGDTVVPEDCRLLIIAGPAHPLADSELAQIDKYLRQGGRLLALLSWYRAGAQPTGLERLLAEWGVAVGNNAVFDKPNSRSGQDVVCTNFSNHPVVRSLQGSSLYLVLPRSVEPARNANQSGDSPKVVPLIATSVNGRCVTELATDGTPREDPFHDRTGVIPLAVAVEKGNLQGMAADRSSTRLIVVGDSHCLENTAFQNGNDANVDFANLAVNWLLDRPQHLAGIAPRPIREYRVDLTQAQMTQVKWLLLVVLPGAALLLGGLVWLRRRR